MNEAKKYEDSRVVKPMKVRWTNELKKALFFKEDNEFMELR